MFVYQINQLDHKEQSPLHVCASRLSYSSKPLRMLIDKGADVSARDSEKRSALHHLALNKKYTSDGAKEAKKARSAICEAVAALLKAGTDASKKDASKKTAIEYARHGDIKDALQRTAKCILL